MPNRDSIYPFTVQNQNVLLKNKLNGKARKLGKKDWNYLLELVLELVRISEFAIIALTDVLSELGIIPQNRNATG